MPTVTVRERRMGACCGLWCLLTMLAVLFGALHTQRLSDQYNALLSSSSLHNPSDSSPSANGAECGDCCNAIARTMQPICQSISELDSIGTDWSELLNETQNVVYKLRIFERDFLDYSDVDNYTKQRAFIRSVNDTYLKIRELEDELYGYIPPKGEPREVHPSDFGGDADYPPFTPDYYYEVNRSMADDFAQNPDHYLTTDFDSSDLASPTDDSMSFDPDIHAVYELPLVEETDDAVGKAWNERINETGNSYQPSRRSLLSRGRRRTTVIPRVYCGTRCRYRPFWPIRECGPRFCHPLAIAGNGQICRRNNNNEWVGGGCTTWPRCDPQICPWREQFSPRPIHPVQRWGCWTVRGAPCYINGRRV